jgi:hypothetical protein
MMLLRQDSWIETNDGFVGIVKVSKQVVTSGTAYTRP